MALVCLTALGVRVWWAAVVPVPPESDFATFHQMAKVIASGAWWPTSYGWLFQGPFYPLVLAPFVALPLDDVAMIRAVNVALQLGTVGCVWVAGRAMFGPRAGLVGAAVAGLYPGIWLFTPLVAGENLAMLLVTGVVTALVARTHASRTFAAGVAAGALVFTRPTFLIFPVLVGLLVAIRHGPGRVQALALYATGVALIILPIALANSAGGGPALPVGNAGWQPWLVYNERATGAWFPAIDQEDYPFRGIYDDAVVRAAQLKLALQFVFANPAAAISSIWTRHLFTWGHDDPGLDWTVGRAASEWQATLPGPEVLYPLVDGIYVAVMALGAIGVFRWRHRLVALGPVILALGYLLVLQIPAEGNERYHVPALPLIAILAGAAFAPGLGWRYVLIAGVIAAVVVAQLWQQPAIWLILLITLLPLAVRVFGSLRSAFERARAHGYSTSRMATVSAGVLVLALTSGGVAGKLFIDRSLAELEAVAPTGWRSYRAIGASPADPPLVEIRPSDTPDGLRKVSYPDAALLQFEGPPATGEVIGLARTLDGLTPGESYTFYLQLYDPGNAGVPGETLSVQLNGLEAWRREGQAAGAPGWQYIALLWNADASALTVQVERRASSAASDAGEPVAVRSLHLLPAY